MVSGAFAANNCPHLSPNDCGKSAVSAQIHQFAGGVFFAHSALMSKQIEKMARQVTIAILFVVVVLLTSISVDTLITTNAVRIAVTQDPEAKKSNNEALSEAASQGDMDTVRALIAAGADVNGQNRYGETPLFHAAEKCRLAIVNALLSAGADPNAKTHNGRTPPSAAAGAGCTDVVDRLLAAGAKADDSESAALRVAAEKGNTDLVKTLLAAGANPNSRSFAGTTALMFAAAGGHLETVKLLLAAGADANAKDRDGMDALLAATAKGHRKITLLLKNAGADVRSEWFAEEVQRTARYFENRLQQTRDFGVLIEEFFAQRFLDCHVETMRERKENGIFSQIGVSLQPEVSSKASDEELSRYLITALNFFHLKTLHRLSTREPGSQSTTSGNSAQEYPPDAHELMMKNPNLESNATSIDQLRQKVELMESAVQLMRDHFVANPPEQTEIFKRNLERIGNNEYNSKFMEIGLYKPSEKDSQEGSKCLGLPVRQLIVIKVSPVYRLFLVQVRKGFKIGALLCTEPPCSD